MVIMLCGVIFNCYFDIEFMFCFEFYWEDIEIVEYIGVDKS